MSEGIMEQSHQSEYLTADQVRQGVTGHNVRFVLSWGLAGATIALAATLLIYTSA
jgi:hypothetical protein